MSTNVAPAVIRQSNKAVPFVCAAALIAVALLAWRGVSPPAPRTSVSSGEFSVARVKATLDRLVGDGAPHPSGTAMNATVRDRIVSELTQAGYAPQLTSAFTCSKYGTCAEVHNIVAVLPGKLSGPYVLAAAHYDSVGAGPGASDDASGIATLLEVARTLKSGPPMQHPLVFLFDDGEELGLLGAKAFVEQNPLAQKVRWAVNLEARGTSGASLMFETSDNNATLIKQYASSVTHPVTNSLMYEIYRRLPNDTDFTVFKAHKMEGYNLAFIGDAAEYHRPADSTGNISQASLQDQGDHALALVRSLANSEDAPRASGNAVFFDVFGVAVLWWRARFTLGLLAVAVAFLGAAGFLLAKHGSLGFASFLRGALGWIVLLFASLALGFLVQAGLSFSGGLPGGWPAHPLPAVITFFALATAVASAVLGVVLRRTTIWQFLFATWTMYALISFLLGSSGATYLFLVPALSGALILCVAAFCGAERPACIDAAIFLPAMVLVVVWLPVMQLLYDGLGTFGFFLIAGFAAMMLSVLLANLSPALLRRISFIGAGVAIIGIFAIYLTPRYSNKAAAPMNIVFHRDADSGSSRWLLTSRTAPGELATVVKSSGLAFARSQAFPWWSAPMLSATAPSVEMAAPVLEGLHIQNEQGHMKIEGRLRSPRGATQAMIFFPPTTRIVSANLGGANVPLQTTSTTGYPPGYWRRFSSTIGPEGLEADFVIDSGSAKEIYVADQSYGIPQAANALLQARGAIAAPIQDGDVTIVSRRIPLEETK